MKTIELALPFRSFYGGKSCIWLKSLDILSLISSFRALTLDNTLVILSTVAPDAGRYYAQAVNDKNGENKTSQPVILNVESK